MRNKGNGEDAPSYRRGAAATRLLHAATQPLIPLPGSRHRFIGPAPSPVKLLEEKYCTQQVASRRGAARGYCAHTNERHGHLGTHERCDANDEVSNREGTVGSAWGRGWGYPESERWRRRRRRRKRRRQGEQRREGRDKVGERERNKGTMRERAGVARWKGFPAKTVGGFYDKNECTMVFSPSHLNKLYIRVLNIKNLNVILFSLTKLDF